MAKETVESLYAKAQQAVARGENDAARRFFMQALALKSDAADVHYGLATACFLLQDLAGAVYHFKEVIRLNPQRAGAHVNLGAIYNRLGKLDEAINELRRGIQLDPKRAEGFYNLGIIYRRQGQLDLAIQAYREAVRINPRMSDAHYNIGNIYFEREQYGHALTHYKQALEVQPKWEKAQHCVQQCEAILGRAIQPPAVAEVANKSSHAVTGGSIAQESHLDPKRSLNPEAHGLMLTSLHRATIEADGISRTFLKTLESVVEPAIKELTSCLLNHRSGPIEVEKCLHNFETAIAGMRSAQKDMHDSVSRIQKVGEKLLGT